MTKVNLNPSQNHECVYPWFEWIHIKYNNRALHHLFNDLVFQNPCSHFISPSCQPHGNSRSFYFDHFCRSACNRGQNHLLSQIYWQYIHYTGIPHSWIKTGILCLDLQTFTKVYHYTSSRVFQILRENTSVYTKVAG